MRVRPFCLILTILAFGARPAIAQVTVGPNIEWSYWKFPSHFSDESGNTLSMGSSEISPGLRVGYLFPGGSSTLALDAGIQVFHFGGHNVYTNVVVEPMLAYAFLREQATSPYVSLSTGWRRIEQGGGSDVTCPALGGALGIRHRVAAGHGFIRGELRYDHFFQKDNASSVIAESIVGLRLGCDLLLSK